MQGEQRAAFPCVFLMVSMVMFRTALCVISLAFAIGAVNLVPFSLTARYVERYHADDVYVSWLAMPDLRQTLWSTTYWGCAASLFMLLPFAYFYYEADGLSISGRKSVLSRIWETMVVLILLSPLLGLLMYALQGLATDDHVDGDGGVIDSIKYHIAPFLRQYVIDVGADAGLVDIVWSHALIGVRLTISTFIMIGSWLFLGMRVMVMMMTY